MRRALVAPFAALAVAVLAGGCSAKPVGQLLLVVQSDLSLPKDIDTIRIEILTAGVPKFKNDYTRLGTTDGQIRLPGTLGLIAPDKADDAVQVIVSARSGGVDGDVRIIREVVTTVPPDRVATLEVPVQFLCDGQAKLANGSPTSTCPDGKTCIAGTCVDKKTDPATLPDYTEPDVYGDGSCFDATVCWAAPTVAEVDMGTCTIAGAKNINVALQTEGEGICGPIGCFVTLDAESPEGWTTQKDGRIALPPAVCKKPNADRIVDVVTTPVTTGCGQKNTSLPTCGPWSSAKHNAPPYKGATALAGGQPLPVALALGDAGVIWTNAGLTGAVGSIKVVGTAGGTPSAIQSPSTAPRALVTAGTAVYWTDAPGMLGQGGLYKADGGQVTQLVPSLDAPEGIAVAGSKLFWTDFQGGGISSASLSGANAQTIAQGNYPYRIVADAQYAYWTNEGTAGTTPPDGSIARVDHKNGGMVEVVAPAQTTPRAIALESGTNGTTAVWWTNFAAEGAVLRATIDASGAVGAPEIMADKMAYPNGITVDENNVYWTNRGGGTVMSLPRTAKAGDAPKTLASGQLAPGAITTDATSVYWVAEGASQNPSGAVVRLPK